MTVSKNATIINQVLACFSQLKMTLSYGLLINIADEKDEVNRIV